LWEKNNFQHRQVLQKTKAKLFCEKAIAKGRIKIFNNFLSLVIVIPPTLLIYQTIIHSMVEVKKSPKVIRLSNTVNRIMYGIMVALAIYFWYAGNTGYAPVYLGLALIFDPFRQEEGWSQRPVYQKVWLLVHVGLLFMLFGWQWFFM
jgi:hypothetical protein